MPRQVRIEFPGASYHCMARGNRREDIVLDDTDREHFVGLLEELVGRTGWRIFAWVLMGNHYHLAIKTPEPNLVAGMKWLQNTWTKRFNARHGLWGHVFGGRYKAVPVEDNEHLSSLIDYIHLNPFRAGLVRKGMGLEDYRWSSLPDYMLPPQRRREWIRVEDGLRQRGYLGDRVAERRRYLEHLGEIARNEKGHPRLPGDDGRSLQSTLRRGWYLGAEGFKEALMARLDALKGARPGVCEPASGYTGEQQRDHGEATAESIIHRGLEAIGMAAADLGRLKKGDWRKRVIGRLVRERTVVPLGWIAGRLAMGNVSRVSKLLATPPAPDWGPDWRRARAFARKLASMSENLA